MLYWWVNQNQTYRQEIDGGYMWSPKVSKNGKLNPFYEFMREVAPGDLIFSFADTRIKAIGIAPVSVLRLPQAAGVWYGRPCLGRRRLARGCSLA